METVPCNLCGSADHRLVYRMPDVHYHPDEWFSVVACRGCGLGFVNPRPSYAEMARYYPSAFYDYFTEQPQFHARRYAVEARFVERAATTGGRRLLDVGCANGDFPRYMQRLGWQVEGVEVSANTRQVGGFLVYAEHFPGIPVGEPTYDVVTAWAVLEHVHDPMAYFQKAAQVLKPGGAFVFLVTNFDSLSSRRLFREDPPRHLYFFTERAVREYVRATGFALAAADYSDRVYGMHPVNWLVYYLHYRLRGREFRWPDAQAPISRQQYLEAGRLEPTRINSLRFAASHPVYVLDRLLMPLYARWQMLTRRYGIVTYVARRADRG